MQTLLIVLMALGLSAVFLPITSLRADDEAAAPRAPAAQIPSGHPPSLEQQLPAGADLVLTPEKKAELKNVVDKYKNYRDQQQKALDATEGN